MAAALTIQPGSAYCIIVTVQREYHLVDNICAGVRERRTGKWLLGHETLNLRAGGSVQCFSGRRWFFPGEPRIGEATWFVKNQRPVTIESVLGIERPAGIAREFLLHLAYRAAAVQPTESTVAAVQSALSTATRVKIASLPANEPQPDQETDTEQEAAGESAVRVTTVNLRPRQRFNAAPAPSLATEKIVRFFSHIFLPATP